MEKSMKRYMPIFVLPTFFAFILGFIIPFILGVGLSFCKFTTVTDAQFIGFSNYAEPLKTLYLDIRSGIRRYLLSHHWL